MNDEKLDLILTLVSDIRMKFNESGKKAIHSEFKTPVETITERLDRLELEIISNRTETLNHRKEIKDLQARVARLEKIINLSV